MFPPGRVFPTSASGSFTSEARPRDFTPGDQDRSKVQAINQFKTQRKGLKMEGQPHRRVLTPQLSKDRPSRSFFLSSIHLHALPIQKSAVTKIRASPPITQFKNVTLRRKFPNSGIGVNLELLAVAGAVESVESVFYFPSGLRESAKRLLFLSPRQSPQCGNGVTFLYCATIYPRVTF
jgi:hypothetical protein